MREREKENGEKQLFLYFASFSAIFRLNAVARGEFIHTTNFSSNRIATVLTLPSPISFSMYIAVSHSKY